MASKLKDYALALIKAWYIKFGERYHQLGIAFDFLMNHGYMKDNGSSLSNIHASNMNNSGIDVIIFICLCHHKMKLITFYVIQARRKAIQLSRYDLLKADVEDHIDNIQDNLTTMEGCFEILIPKHDLMHDDINFDALLRGEVSSNQTQEETYKDVWTNLNKLYCILIYSIEYAFSWFRF